MLTDPIQRRRAKLFDGPIFSRKMSEGLRFPSWLPFKSRRAESFSSRQVSLQAAPLHPLPSKIRSLFQAEAGGVECKAIHPM